MQTIFLDDSQTSTVVQSHEAVEVRDPVGILLGHVMPNGVGNVSLKDDHWVACWNEWYSAIDEPELLVTSH